MPCSSIEKSKLKITIQTGITVKIIRTLDQLIDKNIYVPGSLPVGIAEGTWTLRYSIMTNRAIEGLSIAYMLIYGFEASSPTDKQKRRITGTEADNCHCVFLKGHPYRPPCKVPTIFGALYLKTWGWPCLLPQQRSILKQPCRKL